MTKNSKVSGKFKEPIGLNGVKENPDGTFTGYFFRADGGPHATKEYKTKQEFYDNSFQDRLDLLGEHA